MAYSRPLRVVGGLVLVLAGTSSLLSGGCEVIGASATTASGADIAAKLSQALEADGRAIGPEVKRDLERASASGPAVLAAGVVTLLAGACCMIAGILLLGARAKWFAIGAAVLGIIGELVVWASIGFYPIGLVKIALFALGGAAAVGLLLSARRGAPQPLRS